MPIQLTSHCAAVRSLLSLVGAFALTAGCSGGGGGSDTTRSDSGADTSDNGLGDLDRPDSEGADEGPDTGEEAGTDAAPDVVPDSGEDAQDDSDPDLPPPDAADGGELDASDDLALDDISPVDTSDDSTPTDTQTGDSTPTDTTTGDSTPTDTTTADTTPLDATPGDAATDDLGPLDSSLGDAASDDVPADDVSPADTSLGDASVTDVPADFGGGDDAGDPDAPADADALADSGSGADTTPDSGEDGSPDADAAPDASDAAPDAPDLAADAEQDLADLLDSAQDVPSDPDAAGDATSDLFDLPDLPGGACTNAADLAILGSSGEAVQNEVLSCAFPCLSAPDVSDCSLDCIGAATGLSTACSSCWADLAECVISDCSAECGAGLDSPECTACQSAVCAPAFEICAGWRSVPEPPFCDASSDQAIIRSASADVDGEAHLCANACAADPDVPACVADCFAAATGISDDCAGCYGSREECALIGCASECASDYSAPECTACTAAYCGDDFATCSGIASTPDLDACANPGDMAIIGTDYTSLNPVVTACAYECFTTSDPSACIADCIVVETGITSGCAFCYGNYVDCTLDFCLGPCVADPESPACTSCQTDYCNAPFLTCSGL